MGAFAWAGCVVADVDKEAPSLGCYRGNLLLANPRGQRMEGGCRFEAARGSTSFMLLGGERTT
jgi:hypothetical protein